NVPLMHELGKTAEQRQVLTLVSSPPSLGRPFFTTPDVPADRVAALQQAFAATMKDDAFLAEAKQLGLEMEPMTAEAVTEIARAPLRHPPDLAPKARAAIEPQGGGGKQE